MDLKIDEIVGDCLSALVYTKDDSVKLYEYQLSQLSELGKSYYSEFLKNELSELEIDKLLEEAYKYDFENVILIKESFVKTKNLNEVEIFNANNEFIDNKRAELLEIYNSLLNSHPHYIESIESQSNHNTQQPTIRKKELSNTFKWESSIDALKLLHSELINNNLIAETTFETFELGFSGLKTEEPLKISWVNISKKKLTSKVSLHYLLDKLHPQFIQFPYVFGYTAFTNVFCDKNNEQFKGVKQSMKDYRENGLKNQNTKTIIDTIIEKIENLPQK